MWKQREDIRKLLEENGWRVLEDDSDYPLDWWAAEIWRVESVWSPQGFSVWLTFLVDPMESPFTKPKHNYVWAVEVTRNHPKFSDDKGIRLTLGKGWKKGVPKFLSELLHLRREAATNMIEQ